MPDHSPAFFETDKLPRWRSALLGAWLWVRMRFRNTPGFATAAVAGTLGLVLCLAALFFQGGAIFSGPATEANEESDLVAKPGEEEESPGETAAESAVDPFEQPDELGSGFGKPGALAASRFDLPEETTDEDVPFEREPPARPIAQARPVRRNPLLDDESANATRLKERQIEAASPVLSPYAPLIPAETAEPDLTLTTQEPPADDGATFITRMRPPTESREEAEPEEEADAVPLVLEREPVERTRPARLFEEEETLPETVQEPAVGEIVPTEQIERIEPRDTSEELPLNVNDAPLEEPVVDEPPLEPRQPARWKNSPAGSSRANATPPLPLAEQSEEVQTTIQVEPEPALEREPALEPEPVEPSAIERSPIEPRVIEPAAAEVRPAPSAVHLEIHSLRNVAPGRAIELEVVIVNLGDAPVQDAILSVGLPSSLSHSLGNALERKLGVLGSHELRRARLTVQAVADGPYALQADVSSRGKIAARLSKTVGANRAVSPLSRNVIDDCYCAPAR